MKAEKLPSRTRSRAATESAAIKNPAPLAAALGQNQEVQEKVEVAADALGVANQEVKGKIAGGATMVPAQKVLADGEKVEGKVQEAAHDLLEVNETLAKGIEDLKKLELALTNARAALAQTKVALTTTRGQEKEARLRSLHDAKTGMPNRDLFNDRLTHAISLADRHHWNLAVLFLDLDQFKSINDTHGHSIGDLVLKELAKRLLHRSRDEDTVCRNGGDEFLYLLINPGAHENVQRIATDIANMISEPMDIAGLKLGIRASIGIAVYPEHGATADQLIVNADAAMYRAKECSGGCVICDAPGLLSGVHPR